MNHFHVSELYASNKIMCCTRFVRMRIFSKNSKEIKIQSTINDKLICTNVFKLKLIFCNCSAVIAYMIIEIEMDFNLENQITPTHLVPKVLLG